MSLTSGNRNGESEQAASTGTAHGHLALGENPVFPGDVPTYHMTIEIDGPAGQTLRPGHPRPWFSREFHAVLSALNL